LHFDQGGDVVVGHVLLGPREVVADAQRSELLAGDGPSWSRERDHYVFLEKAGLADSEQQVQIGVLATFLCSKLRPNDQHHRACLDLAVEVRDRFARGRVGLVQQSNLGDSVGQPRGRGLVSIRHDLRRKDDAVVSLFGFLRRSTLHTDGRTRRRDRGREQENHPP